VRESNATIHIGGEKTFRENLGILNKCINLFRGGIITITSIYDINTTYPSVGMVYGGVGNI
jgi:hypothetical protein